MLEQLDSRELSDWLAFERVEPFGDEWRQIARLCAVVANLVKEERADAIDEELFMPLPRDDEEDEDEEDEEAAEREAQQQLAIWRQIAARQRAREAQKGKR